MDAKEIDSGYRCNDVILLESHFERSIEVPDTIQGAVAIKTGYEIDSNKGNVVCAVEIKYECVLEDKNLVSAKIKMVGVFSVIGTPKLPIEQFAIINGPAIVYPFIREHLASLSTKAGIATIMLSPVNFTKGQPIKE